MRFITSPMRLIIVILLCLSFYFLQISDGIKFYNHTSRNLSDTVVTKLAVIQFDQEGKLVNHLYTPELRLLPNKNLYTLKMPHIVVKRPNEIAWQITSNYALIPAKGSKITFKKKVLIQQVGSIGDISHTMRTESLTYYPHTHLAVSKVEVVFQQPGSIVHAHGMYADLASKHIRLLGKPSATFDPHHV